MSLKKCKNRLCQHDCFTLTSVYNSWISGDVLTSCDIMPFDTDNLNGFGPSKRNSSTKVTLPKALAETGMALPRVIKAARRFRRSIFDGFIRESWFPSSLSPLHSQAAGSWSLDHGGHGTTSTRPFDPVMLVKTMQFPPPKREKNELAIKFLSWFLGSKSGGI